MELSSGKVSGNALKRSVLGKIGDLPDGLSDAGAGRAFSGLRFSGAGIGGDCGSIASADGSPLALTTDPVIGAGKEAGLFSVYAAVNDLAAAGAEPLAILLSVLLPQGSQEEDLAALMEQVSAVCSRLSVGLIGGHTGVTSAVSEPVLNVTGIGRGPESGLVTSSGALPGMDLIVTKWVGLSGTAVLARERRKDLLQRLPEPLLDTGAAFSDDLSVLPESRIARTFGAAAMHDVAEGGIAGALWELCEASGVGLLCDLKDVPIRQETVEITEYFEIDPYRLQGMGSLLIAVSDGNGLMAALKEAGIPAALVGRTTDGRDRVIRCGEITRFLTPPAEDELYKALTWRKA